MDDVEFSIIMSAWNDARWLPDSIAGIVAQTNPNFELLVAEDASTDHTRAVLTELATDPRIRVFEKDAPRLGLLASLNMLASQARGRYIVVQCPDDVMAPDCLERASEFLKVHPNVGYLILGYQMIDPQGRLRESTRRRLPNSDVFDGLDMDEFAFVHGCPASLSSLVIPVQIWREFGGFIDVSVGNVEKFPTAEDFEIMSRLQGKYCVGYISKPVVYYREHPNQAQFHSSYRPFYFGAQFLVEERIGRRLLAAGRLTEKQLQNIYLDRWTMRLVSVIKLALSGRFKAARDLYRHFPPRSTVTGTIAAIAAYQVWPRLQMRWSRFGQTARRLWRSAS